MTWFNTSYTMCWRFSYSFHDFLRCGGHPGRREAAADRKCDRAGVYQEHQLEPGLRPLAGADVLYPDQHGADRQIR